MSARPVTRRLVALVLFAAGVLGTAVSRDRLAGATAAPASGRELLYLPNGSYLKAASLGNSGLLADLVYLWAIQYYSIYDRADRYAYVEHVFGRVIAELDPHYVDPYWLGALILTMEKGDLEAGLRLLDQGFAANPEAWNLPHLAGWECDRKGDHLRAAAYFAKAASVSTAPGFVRRLEAGMLRRAGNERAALAEWSGILTDPSSDATSREIAQRQVRDLTVSVDLADLTGAVAAFRAARGRNPHALDELVQAGIVGSIPRDPDGRAYRYDRTTGQVSSPAGRVLGRS